ncbi:MAG: CBS domain-containing protein [Candidatus Micrarchaeota archaeon]
MYFPTGEDIRRRRELLGVSQKQLTQRLSQRGISIRQPYLSKIESEKAEPAYRLMREIVAILDEYENAQSERPLAGFYRPNPKAASPQDKVSEVVRKIRKNGFSQLPVFEKGKNIGRITDAMVLAAERKYGKVQALKKEVGQIMGPPYPMLNVQTPKSEADLMVEKIGAVLVEKEGKIVGIATREDMLG